MLRTPLFFLAAASALGCTGEIGGTPPTPPLEPGAFTCTPGDPSATVLPRLSRRQYEASLAAIVDASLGPGAWTDVGEAVAFTLVGLPDDADGDHARLDQTVSQAHVSAYYHVAVAVAAELTSNPHRVGALLGSCATDLDASNDAACVEAFIRGFGLRAHRRPVSDVELAFYRDEVFAPATAVDPAAVRDVITVMLVSPWFLYRVENEGAAIDERADLFTLSGYELAARLAYHLWDAPPDDSLLEAAASGALSTEEGYEAAVDRMLADPRARATVDRLFAEWLLLDDLAPLHTQLGDPKYDAFVGADVPTEALRERVLEDTLDLVRYTTWDSSGTLDDLFVSDLSFAKTPDVAALYGGVPIWTEGTEPTSVAGRAGILTRPAMLATGSTSTHPVLRGREIRKRVLCDVVPAPPPGAIDNLPEIDPLLGERDRMEALTEQAGSSCAGCHATINPIGYTLEGFDGLGRARTEEPIFADDGSVIASVPVDTAAEPRILPDDDTVVTSGVELSRRVAESGLPHACFARHSFRFAYGRLEDDVVDGCELETVREQLREGGSIRDALKTLVMSQTFRRHKLAD